MKAGSQTLPKNIGPITLDYSPSLRLPSLSKQDTGSIRLPFDEAMKFHTIKDGSQFLVYYPVHFGFGTRTPMLFFGGMDESPFLTGIKPEVYNFFVKGGEEAFFEELKPSAIKYLQSRHPNATVARQGDIWSLRIPQRRVILPQFYTDKKGEMHAFAKGKRKTTPVLGTNHYLEGRYHSVSLIVIDEAVLSGIAIAEGTLTAADHAPHKLVGGLHILARTRHILPPMPARGME